MKTAVKTIRIPRLEIRYDDFAESPRHNDNIWYMDIRDHRRYNFPKELSIAWDEWEETANELIELEKNFYVFPIDCYEHSGISFSLSGTGMQCQFDTSKSVGIIAIPRVYNGYDIKEWNRSKTRDNPQATQVTLTEEQVNTIATEELNEYNQYLNGEVYRFTLLDEEGDEIDSCWGFYDIDDIRDHLWKEWADESMMQYLVD